MRPTPLQEEEGLSILTLPNEAALYALPERVQNALRAYRTGDVRLPDGRVQIQVATYRIAELERMMRE